MKQLTKRQKDILNFIHTKGKASSSEIQKHLEGIHGSVTQMTVIREMQSLGAMKVVSRHGGGRSTYYTESDHLLHRCIDIPAFIKPGSLQRSRQDIPFNQDVFNHLHSFFDEEEAQLLHDTQKKYSAVESTLRPIELKRTLEQLMIEFSWKSSLIEGNTYTLMETETLIVQNKKAANHTREEAIMILNQKDAFDAILESPESFSTLTIGTLENLHKIITQDLGIAANIRKRPVGIGGSYYVPMYNPHQIREALGQTISIINDTTDPFEKAFITLLMISYIQPFEDGNKRTARMLTNAVLAAGNCCPLSWRTVDETEYKKASVVFYETLSARYFKQLFIEQCLFAGEEYFPNL